ncbi:odorant receptor 47a-like [Diachasmimorpha longicaudata]|uniref:odorant receptor 47a-like n=1 Tax=Diachasmimorpha longicaudata TaxID=58733 RepID=UPI0030B8F0F3
MSAAEFMIRRRRTMTVVDTSERPFPLYFRYLLGGDIRMLQATGLYSMGSIMEGCQPKWYFWEVLPFVVVIPALIFGLGCNITNIIGLVQTDYMFAIEVAAATLSSTLTTFKGYRLCAYRREFYCLIKTCHDHWNIQVSQNQITGGIVGTAKKARFFRIFYAFVIIVLLSTYVVQALGGYFLNDHDPANESLKFTKTVYPARYPFHINTPRGFFICVAIETMGMYFISLYWIIVDALFAQLTTHLSLHFQILSEKVRKICPSETIPSSSSAIISNRLKTIVDEYLELFKYVRSLEQLYNPILFATVLVNGIDLCTCLYSLQYRLLENNWKDVVKNMVHACGVALQTLMFCTCAERLNNQIAGVREAFYDCPWIQFTMPIKLSILLMITLSQREYVYSTYGFIQLNMPQVTTIFTAAMRYFTLLRNIA